MLSTSGLGGKTQWICGKRDETTYDEDAIELFFSVGSLWFVCCWCQGEVCETGRRGERDKRRKEMSKLSLDGGR